MIEVKIRDPETGDSTVFLESPAVLDLIRERQEDHVFGFARWDDGTILEMMESTGILEQLERRDGERLTIVPPIAGG